MPVSIVSSERVLLIPRNDNQIITKRGAGPKKTKAEG
jgi:hypothetical protein